MEYEGPRRYEPLGAWSYFGLSILYAIPIIGFIFLLIHTFSDSNINRRSFARSYWCRLLLIILILALLFALAFATGNTEEFQETITQFVSEKVTGSGAGPAIISPYDSYESIYNEYAQKIRETTPSLIEEYNREAQTNTSGITGLAEISNAKIGKLAEIQNQGTQEMAGFMITKGKGNYEEYSEWAAKLTTVYTEESAKITSAYLSSATGNTP